MEASLNVLKWVGNSCLSEWRIGRSVVPCPNLLLCSRLGAVPDVTNDLLDEIVSIRQCPLLFPLSTLSPGMVKSWCQESAVTSRNETLGDSDSRIRVLCNLGQRTTDEKLPPRALLFMIQDATKPFTGGFNTKAFTALWGYGGKYAMDAASWLQHYSLLETDTLRSSSGGSELRSFFQVLCDSDTDAESTSKRCQKSVDHTRVFTETCLRSLKPDSKSSLFVTITGGFDVQRRTAAVRSLLELLSDRNSEASNWKTTATGRSQPGQFGGRIAGIIIEGFHRNGETALDVDFDSFSNILDVVMHELGDLVNEVPVYLPGAWAPMHLLKAVECGISLFDSSICHVMAGQNKALRLSADLIGSRSELDWFCQFGPSSATSNDLTAPVEGCQCYSCLRFSKAYLTHLVNTNELLAPTLLTIHNLHNLASFLGSVRDAIRDGSIGAVVR